THDDDLAKVVQATRRYAGEGSYNDIRWSSTNWHASSNKAGINRRGATINGRNVDGVLPEEQRRSGDFAWPAPRGTYPWTGLQGIVAAHAMLDRAGLMDFSAG